MLSGQEKPIHQVNGRGSTEFRVNSNYKNTVDKKHKFLIDSRSYYDRRSSIEEKNLKLRL